MRTRFVLLAAVALAWPLAGQAQEAPAVSAAKAHFQSTARYASADVADLSVVDSYLDRRTGATHVYLSQRHNGVDVYGTVTAAAVRDGRVFASGDAFQSDLAQRANGSTPSLTAEAALLVGEAHARALTPSLADRTNRALADDAASDAIGEVSYHAPRGAQLVYETVAGDALRLAWSMELIGEGGPTGQQLWNIRVDAQTGAVLAADDLITYEHFGEPAERTDFAPLAETAALPGASAMVGSYRVVPIPFESPNHGTFQLVADPDDADASPFGWHDTNGADGSETTNTTGANATAYRDTDANNTPDPGSQPDGGAALVFDFPFDETLPASGNADAAVVSAFYWTNIVHDVLWHYGFDEPSGNFQTNNYGRGGSQNDPVLAEALDGSGTNNANFGTPSDGSSPRMQMFEWTGAPTFTVTAPADVAGEYPSAGAAFGTADAAVGTAVFAVSPEGGPGTACTVEEVDNQAAIAGNMAFISRGDCNFVDKARVGLELGAIGVVVYNCEPGATGCSTNSPGEGLVTMACPDGESCDDVSIPVAFVQRSTAQTLQGASGPVTAGIETPVSRDSDFDAGVLAHEIGHGLSNRLTGGRFNTGCLGNQEQMGEGWSDYLGMMLTMQATDTAEQPRGVATYLEFEDIDGQGIRPTPYSTDFAVNDVTYDDVINNTSSGLSVPHGIGYAWASMLWDMTWAMIEQDGFGDIYDADGNAGNQKALQLVVEALKLQPCSPGFVDGRDAIFEADALLYDNAHYDLIGAAFAARGLGLNADQGSSASLSDGTADFTPFPPIATETDAAGRVTELAVRGANPFRTATTVELSVGTPQEVTVDVIDLLGRRVATLFAGEMQADTAKRLTVSAADMPSGVYIVRATGETFSLTERVTITR